MTSIEILERAEDYVGIHYINGVEEPYINPCLLAAIKDGVEAIRAKQQAEKNDPLTLEVLREMDGDKIYIQHIGHCKGFYEDVYAPYFGRYEQYVHEYNGMIRATDLPLKYYGTEWLAYRHKPEEEQ